MADESFKRIPLVTVGIPVFNGESSLRMVIENILSQSYPSIEILISDNGSVDNTKSVLSEMKRIYPQIRIFEHETNRGLIWNFNFLLSEAKGEFFLWAAHDDSRSQDYILELASVMNTNTEAVLCFPNTLATWGHERKVIWRTTPGKFSQHLEIGERYKLVLSDFPAVGLYGIYRKSLVDKTRKLPAVMGGDLLFVQECSFYGQIVGLDKNLFVYHQREKWNTREQDYKVFFGEGKHPRPLSPFLRYSIMQIAILASSQLEIRNKVMMGAKLIFHQIQQIMVKLFSKLIIRILPTKIAKKLVKTIYFSFIQSSTIIVEDSENFDERVVFQSFGL